MKSILEAAAFGGLALGVHVAALAALPGPPAGGAPAREGAPIAVATPDATLRSLVEAWDEPPEAVQTPDGLAEPMASEVVAPTAPPELRAASLSPAPVRPEATATPEMPRDPAARPPAARPKARPFAAPPAASGAAGSVRKTAAAPAPGPAAADLERGLGAEVRDALARAQFYPERARARGLAGTTVLDVTISRSGDLVGARVARGSGAEMLDRASLAAAGRAAYPAAPADLAGARFTFRVTLDYRLR